MCPRPHGALGDEPGRLEGVLPGMVAVVAPVVEGLLAETALFLGDAVTEEPPPLLVVLGTSDAPHGIPPWKVLPTYRQDGGKT